MALPRELIEARKKAHVVLRETEKALKKHIQLVKKREKISSIVAMLERLRADLKESDAATIYSHMDRMNELTKGFAARVVKRKVGK